MATKRNEARAESDEGDPIDVGGRRHHLEDRLESDIASSLGQPVRVGRASSAAQPTAAYEPDAASVRNAAILLTLHVDWPDGRFGQRRAIDVVTPNVSYRGLT